MSKDTRHGKIVLEGYAREPGTLLAKSDYRNGQRKRLRSRQICAGQYYLFYYRPGDYAFARMLRVKVEAVELVSDGRFVQFNYPSHLIGWDHSKRYFVDSNGFVKDDPDDYNAFGFFLPDGQVPVAPAASPRITHGSRSVG